MAHADRPRRKRQQRPSVLVLCEGACTEPNYIGALVREFGLTAVSVPRNHKTDPLGLVKLAIEALKADEQLSMVFVVFDHDNHPSFNLAVKLAEQSPFCGKRLHIIRSFPCFETWLILHFEFCRAPMTSEQALAKLRELCPDYDKNSIRCIEKISENLIVALKNSKKALTDAKKTGDFNSSSEMHLLVAQFMKMAS